ncbi:MULTISPECIES: hypothetical protein [unclassified Bartonella]|uniref:hypothetical protein n=1 Tax=unclassified Bartonella TaxID=2645622 RepID=UPI0023609D36|nr:MULTISPECIES: hypothetical protein [unclassified Bartonella]
MVCGSYVSGSSCVHNAASLTEDDQIHDEAIPRFGNDDDDDYRHEYYDEAM